MNAAPKENYFLTISGKIFFTVEGIFNLSLLKKKTLPHYEAYCSDLSIRKVIGVKDKRLATWNPLQLLFTGAASFTALPVLSDPIRTYELSDLKPMIAKYWQGKFGNAGLKRKDFLRVLEAADTFDVLFLLAVRPQDHPEL